MLAWCRSRLTFANVVSMTALFVALSGGAYALTVPKKSVGPKQLKKNAVTRAKIQRGAVTSPKVRDDSLLRKDFKAGQLDGAVPGGAAGGGLAGTYPNPALAPNSAGIDQIQAGAVTTAKIADGAVDSTKVKPGEFVETCGPGSAAAAGSWFAPSLPTDGSFVPPGRFGGEVGFACEGTGLTATKIATGHYRIRTNGIASTFLIQLANAEPGTGQVRHASSNGPFAGDLFDVFVRDAAGALADPQYVSLVLIDAQ